MSSSRTRSWTVVAAGLAMAGCAHSQEHSGRLTPMLPRYQQECSACHVAYPPGLLPASSWQRLLSDLPHHFGTDASLDPAAVAALSSWLMAAAGRGAAPPQDRITTSRWFVHEHDEVPAGVWQRPAVRSASNCVACHAQAEQGVFDEHTVRIPR